MMNSKIMTPTAAGRDWPGLIAAGGIGLAVPLMIPGRGWLQASAAVALLACLWLLRRGAVARPRLAGPHGWACIAVLAGWLPGAVLSFDPLTSLGTWLRTALFLGGSALLLQALRADAGRWRLALKILVGAALVLVVYGDLCAFIPELAWLQRGRVLDLVYTRLGMKAAASAVLCLVPVTLWAGARLGGNWRWAALAMAALSPVLMVTTGSKSSFMGVLAMAAMVVLALLARRSGKLAAAAGLAGGLALAVGGYLLLSKPVPPVMGNPMFAPTWLIDAHRQTIWQFVFARFLDSPLVGNGINIINLLPGAHDTIPGIGAEYVPSHPHNWLVQISAETGLVGTLPMIAAILFVIGRAFRAYAATGHGDLLAQLALLAAFWSSALFNFSFWATWWQLCFLLLMVLVMAASSHRDASR